MIAVIQLDISIVAFSDHISSCFSFLIDSNGILQRIYPGALFSSSNPILDPNSQNFKRMFGYYNQEMISSITSMHDDLVNNIESLLLEDTD